jgi:pimeloyl-ACP methyl ester carboxylesterase
VPTIPYDEFSMFRENADEFGIPWSGAPVVRRERVGLGDGRHLSALVWGDSEPELVFLHGGGQNAHTWDTVALALGRPLVAVDLPGHGHSDSGRRASWSVRDAAGDVATVIGTLAPKAAALVGMSLGGLTALALADASPDLVRSLVLVDVTPGVNADKAAAIRAFLRGPATFTDFDEILERTVQFNPSRSVSSLRRGILHNAVQQPDGTWVWRHRRHAGEGEETAGEDPAELWAAMSRLGVPLLLVRGMGPGSVVDDADEARLLEVQPKARVEHVAGAGHSIQGDAPVELARLLTGFIA